MSRADRIKGEHNGALALRAKVGMRMSVLEHVKPAHVFDAYCGPSGEMWRAVWKRAASYVGCDEVYEPFDPRRRFVGDNRTVMRAIDLQAYNVFDLDAFGEPWEQLTILSVRRTWQAGERGAVILTWSDLKTRWGFASHALASLSGLGSLKVGRKADVAITPMAIRSFFARSNVHPLQAWNASGGSTGKGSNKQTYTAIVFEGLGAAHRERTDGQHVEA